mgnify:CR=1 FL=1
MIGADEEGEVIAFMCRLLPEDFKSVRSQGHKALKHTRQKMFDLHTFLDLDRDTHGVDRRLDKTSFLFTLDDNDWLHQETPIVLKLDLRMHLSFNDLRGEVSQVEHWLQMQANVAQIILHSLDHLYWLSIF